MANQPSLRQRKGAAAAAAETATAGAGAATTGPKGAPERRRVTIPDTGIGYVGITLTTDGSYGVGVRVEDIVKGDLAAKAGLQVNDVVVALNGQDVNEPSKAVRIMEDANGAALHIDFLKQAEAEKTSKVAAAERSARRRAMVGRFFGFIFWVVHKLVVTIVFLAGVLAIAYELAPQDYVKDPLDFILLPHLGFQPPEVGYDGRPIRRVIESKGEHRFASFLLATRRSPTPCIAPRSPFAPVALTAALHCVCVDVCVPSPSQTLRSRGWSPDGMRRRRRTCCCA